MGINANTASLEAPDPKQDRRPPTENPRPRLTKRLNAVISARQHARLEDIFNEHGVKMSEGVRVGLNIFAAALPVLARGGEIVFRERDGTERAYVFPSLVR